MTRTGAISLASEDDKIHKPAPLRLTDVPGIFFASYRYKNLILKTKLCGVGIKFCIVSWPSKITSCSFQDTKNEI